MIFLFVIIVPPQTQAIGWARVIFVCFCSYGYKLFLHPPTLLYFWVLFLFPTKKSEKIKLDEFSYQFLIVNHLKSK